MNERTSRYNAEMESEDLICPVKYFRETGKLTERNIQKAIEMDATHLLYVFHDWCRWAEFIAGKCHLFEEWHKEVKSNG